MKKLLLFLLLTVSFYCQAQNYNCLQPGVKPFFTNGNGYLRSMRIDSVTVSGSDSIFHPYHTPRGNYLQFLTPLDSNGGSWLGKNVIKQTDGTFLFDDIWQDTVVIKAQALVGDSWTFYDDTTNVSYKATVTSLDTMTISGNIDSVKTITIEADTNGVINLSDPVNGFKIILSKNNGFVQVFDLYTFPYHIPGNISIGMEGYDYYLDLVQDRLLCLCDLPPSTNNADSNNSIFHIVSFYNPTMMQLYNFSVGEIMEYQETTNFYEGNAVDLSIDTILSKTGIPTSVSYTIAERTSSRTTNWVSGGPPIITTTGSYGSGGSESYDTTILIDFTYLPEEWNVPYFYHYFPQYAYDSGGACPNTGWTIDVNNIAYPSGTIIFAYPPEGAGLGLISKTTYLYSIGFGLSGYYYYEYGSSYFTTYETGGYIYVSNGDSVCGGYAIPPTLSVNQLNAFATITDIFPNPANDILNINASATISQVTITNLLGQAVYTNNESNGNKMQVDISMLPAGIYIVKINNTDVRKFVKE